MAEPAGITTAAFWRWTEGMLYLVRGGVGVLCGSIDVDLDGGAWAWRCEGLRTSGVVSTRADAETALIEALRSHAQAILQATAALPAQGEPR